MCTGVLEIAALAGAALSAGSAVQASNERSAQADSDAAYAKDEAAAQAEKLVRARRRQVGAARAATAASGTALDSFSEINTNEIERMGSSDESMTLLTGQRRANSLTYGNDAQETSAKMNAIGGLMTTGYQVGWKGSRGNTPRKE